MARSPSSPDPGGGHAPESRLRSLGAAHRSVLADMRLALLSEIGAREVYAGLSRWTRDLELRSVLERLNEEGAENVARLQELMRGLGGRPPHTSLRRRALARALVLGARVVGPRPVLRVCLDAEQTVARWYRKYGAFFLRLGDRDRALPCGELAARKEAHARALETWVTNLRRRQ